MRTCEVRIKVKVHKARTRMKPHQGRKERKAGKKQRNKSTQARKAREYVRNVGA